MTIAEQLREAAHRDYVFFTCLIVRYISPSLRSRYAARFSVKDNGGSNFTLSDDPETEPTPTHSRYCAKNGDVRRYASRLICSNRGICDSRLCVPNNCRMCLHRAGYRMVHH